MANTKNQFEKIVDNQKQLVDKLSKNASAIADLYKVNEVPGMKIVEAYQKETKALLDLWFKPVEPAKFVEEIPAKLKETINLQNKFYKESFDFALNFWKKLDTAEYEKKYHTAEKLYKESVEVITETTKKNLETLTDAK
jgi:hypothetical protein